MSLQSISSGTENTAKLILWGGELNHERLTCTFRPQGEKKDSCRLLLSTICLGEKAKEEVNRVEVLPSANLEDKKLPVTIASLRASVLPMTTMTGMELCPPVTFRLRAGSGPVFLSGHECYETSDIPWEDDEEEEEDGEEEEEEEEDEDEDVDISLEETPIKQVKRVAPQKQMSLAKKKKIEKEEEETVSTQNNEYQKETPKTRNPPRENAPRQSLAVLKAVEASANQKLKRNPAQTSANWSNWSPLNSHRNEDGRPSPQDKSPRKRGKATPRPRKSALKK